MWKSDKVSNLDILVSSNINLNKRINVIIAIIIKNHLPPEKILKAPPSFST